MNTPIDLKVATCMRLTMSDLDRDALEKDGGKTSVVLAIVPRSGLEYGATHAVYQLIRGRAGEENPRVGFVRFYRSDAVPAELLTPDLFQP